MRLTLAAYGQPVERAAYQKVAEAFTETHPRVRVRVEAAEDAGSSFEQLRSSLGSDTAPDVFLVPHEHAAVLYEEGHTQPVDALLEARGLDFGDGYRREGLEAFSADGGLQCMPYDVSPYVVYYNADLIDLSQLATEEDEAPTAEDGWTWEQFVAAAEGVSTRRVKGVYLEPTLEGFAPFAWSAGAALVDSLQEPTTLTLDNEDTREALDRVLPLVRNRRVSPTPRQIERVDALTRFREGRLAMMIATRSVLPQLRTAVNLDVGVMPMPRIQRMRTYSPMTALCLNSATEHVQEAADLLSFAVGDTGAGIITETGAVVPSNLDVANSGVFAQSQLQPADSFVFLEGIRRTERVPFVGVWRNVTQQTDPMIRLLYHGRTVDVDQVLARIDSRSKPRFQAAQQPEAES